MLVGNFVKTLFTIEVLCIVYFYAYPNKKPHSFSLNIYITFTFKAEVPQKPL